jgi:hypothetical protein
MEVAVLLGAVFVGLIGLAVWFGRRQSSPTAATAPEPAPREPARSSTADDPADDATGEPAAVRDEANRPPTVFVAAATGHVRGLRDLLDANPLVSRLEQMDERGWTALHHAAYHDQIPCIRLLVERNANVEAVAEGECVPLHMAATQGSVEAVALLVDAGADVDTPDETGATALHYACLPGRPEMVAALLAHGAEPNVKNSRGETPLDLATRLGDDTMRAALEEAGARPGADVRMAEVLEKHAGRPLATRVPAVWHLDAEGPELTAAHAAAQAALPSLQAHLEAHPDAPVAVKFALRDDDLVEYVWAEVTARGERWTVRLSSPPTAVPEPEAPVQVDPSDIADWQVRLPPDHPAGPARAGGYTQRAVLDALEAEFGFLPADRQAERDALVDL